MMDSFLRLRRQIIRYLAREVLRPVVGKKIVAALSTAAATAPLRLIDDTDPLTWEFTGFSQNGEDGVIDYLTRKCFIPLSIF